MAARYDAIADFHAEQTGDDVADRATAALLDLSGDVSGLRVLDLACGHGRVTRELADRGARVVGIDISGALIEQARAAERAKPRAIAYVHGDVTALTALDGEHFDAVVCNYGLSDIDDLDGALATVTRALVPGGVWCARSSIRASPAGARTRRAVRRRAAATTKRAGGSQITRDSAGRSARTIACCPRT
ncbi:MAG: class I SAM-dependent methyltransferase [Chloroflexi bacterium]|nr:class I SAM-dependent methyltransferase [Chloroflexota bacterium]MDA1002675.1 class I SAM-dependent methyltransferase [Chloroflexota bacterium]MQC27575.1 class I SAM-dependent methyltransferase [Chloroflexota bacterium]